MIYQDIVNECWAILIHFPSQPIIYMIYSMRSACGVDILSYSLPRHCSSLKAVSFDHHISQKILHSYNLFTFLASILGNWLKSSSKRACSPVADRFKGPCLIQSVHCKNKSAMCSETYFQIYLCSDHWNLCSDLYSRFHCNYIQIWIHTFTVKAGIQIST